MATVLLVDDDLSFAEPTARALVAAGIAVLSAKDSNDALGLLDRRRVDLLLTDIRMPVGMPHGYALARMARLRQPTVKILYITGYEDLAEAGRRFASGKILRKPITTDALIAEVEAALGRPRPGA